jgi:hypothetical protein
MRRVAEGIKTYRAFDHGRPVLVDHRFVIASHVLHAMRHAIQLIFINFDEGFWSLLASNRASKSLGADQRGNHV